MENGRQTLHNFLSKNIYFLVGQCDSPGQPLNGRHAHAVLVHRLSQCWLLIVIRQQPQHLGQVLARLALILVPTCMQEARDCAHTRRNIPANTHRFNVSLLTKKHQLTTANGTTDQELMFSQTVTVFFNLWRHLNGNLWTVLCLASRSIKHSGDGFSKIKCSYEKPVLKQESDKKGQEKFSKCISITWSLRKS